MVIFGGLELVAAGYILHKHNQNKRERRRLREDAELLEEEEEEYYRRTNGHSHHRRRHSYDDRDEEPYVYDNRPQHDPAVPSQSHSQQPVGAKPQHLNPGYYAPPPRASSAPPQDPNFPPTGWPEHWKQSQQADPNGPPAYTPPNATPYLPYQAPPYQAPPYQAPPYQGSPYQAPPAGPSRDSRRPARSTSPRVHFEDELPASQTGSGRHSGDRRPGRRGEGSDGGRRTSGHSDPPPEYRV